MILYVYYCAYFNPLSSNSDQHQISPCNINAYSTPEDIRIKDRSPKVNFLDLLITSPQYLLEKYGDKIGEFVL